LPIEAEFTPTLTKDENSLGNDQQENQKEEAESLLLFHLQAGRLEKYGDEIGANFAANELEGGNQRAVQAGGVADHLVHPGVGRFFVCGSTRRTSLFGERVDVVFFTLAIPKERRCVERIRSSNVVRFDQYEFDFRHGIPPG